MKRNKIINLIIAVFVGTFLFCLYFSKTIKNMLLTEVTVVNLKSGAIGDSFEANGITKYNNTHKICGFSNWNIKEITVKVNQKVKKGDVLGKVDNDEIILAEREEEIQILKLQDEIKALKNTPDPDKNKIQEMVYELETERLKLQQVRKGLTEDGSILSDIDGSIVSINTNNSGNSTSSEPLFELVDNKPSFSVNFEADHKDAERFSIGDKINVFVKTDEKNSKENKVTAAISEKIYDVENDRYKFTAEIDDTLTIKGGDKVTVSSIDETKRYDNVIPKSCLSEDNGLDYIYVVNMRSGALGGEEYVQKVQVEVTAADDKNCAVKIAEGEAIPTNYGIVMSTSKSIEDNSEVKLDTEN